MHTRSLSKRERQIMDVLYRLGRATAGEVREALSGGPSDSTVRTQLRVLETKGHVVHEAQGNRFIYAPSVPRDRGAGHVASACRRHVTGRSGHGGRRVGVAPGE